MQNTVPISERMAFLVYDSRSGSTHLASLLDTHPHFCISLESEFLLKAYNLNQGAVSGETLALLVAKDLKLHDWGPGTLELVEDMLAKDPEMDAEALMERLFEATLAKRKPGARWLALKQGLLADHLPHLLRRWPKAAIIHIYRDGRGVFNSKRKFKNIDTGRPMQSDPKKAANRWVRVIRAFENLPADATLIEVAFESLVRNQDRELPRIFRTLGLDPALARPDMASGYADAIPEKQKELHPLVGRTPDASRIDIWKTELSPQHIRAYEEIAGPMLEAKGYARVSKPSILGHIGKMFTPKPKQTRSGA